MPHSTFRDNVVILTGASSGIGKSIALQLADNGAWLALAAREPGQLNEVSKLCRQRGGRAIALSTDVSQNEQCERLIRKTVDHYGKLDTLINNAGISMKAKLEDLQDITILEKLIQINYLGSAYCTYYALPHLINTKGRIVAVSSLAGKTGVPALSGYAASKHAMVGFFESIRIELALAKVSVTIVSPGFVATQIRERSFGPDGNFLAKRPARTTRIISADTCARRIIKATANRDREVLLPTQAKLGLWVKLIAPGLVDKISKQIFENRR